jgi:transcriptional regulator with XRE-family HTH domain
MEDKLTIGSLIKRHIKMRGKTVKEVSEALGRNYTTFSGILNRDVVDAKLLFELANLLDIDLVWMAELFDHRKPISMFAQYQLPRMQSDFRKHDYQDVLDQLDFCIRNNPDSIADARKELLSIYPNMFYVLDILMPEAQAQPFLDRLTDMSAGTIEGMETGQEYRAFPIEQGVVT